MAVDVVRTGFADWAAARTAVLLRLAYLVTGSRDSADTLVRDALDRLEARWSDVVRTDDPDRYARRVVVTTQVRPLRGAEGLADPVWLAFLRLPDRTRAGLVLRLVDGLDDIEIADLLGCSPSWVRSCVDRGVASLTPAASPTLRDLLVRKSAEAAVELRPSAARGRRRRRAWRTPSWIAGLAVLLVMVTVTVVAHETSSPAGAIRYLPVAVPSTWRYESYAGVQLRVPASWGWGGSPVHGDFATGHLGGCGSDRAYALPGRDGGYVPATTPYVGRPVRLTDRCVSWGSDGVLPVTDAVWFDSPLPLGIRSMAGRVAETRSAGGQHITVFSADAALRRRILGSVSEVDVDANGCPSLAVQTPTPGVSALDASSLSVCVYSQDTGQALLLWSARRDRVAAQDYVAAFAAARTRPACHGTPQGAWVALGIADEHGGATRWDVLDLRCDRLVGSAGDAGLTPATVGTWAADGTRAYVRAPQGLPAVASYFRPAAG